MTNDFLTDHSQNVSYRQIKWIILHYCIGEAWIMEYEWLPQYKIDRLLETVCISSTDKYPTGPISSDICCGEHSSLSSDCFSDRLGVTGSDNNSGTSTKWEAII